MSISIEQIQLVALASVEDPDWEAQYRDICRWYSREFSTPLHYVENELSALQVLKHYYEDSFKKLSNSSDEMQVKRYNDIKNRIIYGNLGEEELNEMEEDDDEWAAKMIEEIKADEEKRKKLQKKAERKQKVKTVKADNAETLKNPNLEEDIQFSVHGEDGPLGS